MLDSPPVHWPANNKLTTGRNFESRKWLTPQTRFVEVLVAGLKILLDLEIVVVLCLLYELNCYKK